MKIDKRSNSYINMAVFIATWVLSFALTNVALSNVPAPLVALGRALFGFAFIALLLGGVPKNRPNKRQLITIGAGGAALALFLLLQVLFRYSIIPSGSDVAFITGLTPLFVLPISAFWLKDKVSGRQVIGTAIAILGMAAVVGNWERPSSFAPFARFPLEELALLGSAVAFAGVVSVGRKLRDINPATLSFYLLGYASALLAVYALISGSLMNLPSIEMSSFVSVVLLGVLGTGVALLAMLAVSREIESHRVSAIITLTPVLLTLYLFVDRKASGLPIELNAVIAGSIITIAGVVLAMSKETVTTSKAADLSRSIAQVAMLLGAVGAVLAVVSLFSPVRESFVKGVLDSGKPYKAAWATGGYETIGPYLLLGIALLTALACLKFVAGNISKRALFSTALATTVLTVASWIPAGTPFVAWYSWMPPEIQHAFGTEFVFLREITLTNLPFVLSAAFAVLASLLSAISALKLRSPEV